MFSFSEEAYWTLTSTWLGEDTRTRMFLQQTKTWHVLDVKKQKQANKKKTFSDIDRN